MLVDGFVASKLEHLIPLFASRLYAAVWEMV